MAFRLKIDKSLKAGVRKAARRQLDDAVRRLQGDAEQRAGAVHDIRVHLKKLRALVRLIRGALGDQYRRENTCFRDVARHLSGRRDVQAALDMLGKLCQRSRRQQATADAAAVLCAVRARLAARQQTAAEAADEHDWQALAEELRAASRRAASWTDCLDGFETLAAGFEECYRRARRAMDRALQERTPELLHEWRKQTKYHRYQLNLLEDAWPQALEPMSNVLEELSDLLGDDHDLVVLRAMAASDDGELCPSEAERELCLNVFDERRDELFEQFKPLGQLYFAEKPKHLRRRLEKYWKVRRSEAKRKTSSGGV